MPGKFFVGKNEIVAMSPMVPTAHSPSADPNACAASSMTDRPFSAAVVRMGVIEAAWPKMCTGMIALVLSVTFSSMRSGSRQAPTGSTSTKTGVAPWRAMASAVA